MSFNRLLNSPHRDTIGIPGQSWAKQDRGPMLHSMPLLVKGACLFLLIRAATSTSSNGGEDTQF